MKFHPRRPGRAVSVHSSDEPPLSLEEILAQNAGSQVGLVTALHACLKKDPDSFAEAALRILVSERSGPAVSLIASLACQHPVVLRYLTDPEGASLREAIALAQRLNACGTRADLLLLQHIRWAAQGDVAALSPSSTMRVLRIWRATSDASCLLPFLVQLLRHPNRQIRCKALFLINSANVNVRRAEECMAKTMDPRARANIVVALWPVAKRAAKVFLQAARDPNCLVSISALVGLSRAGDREGAEILAEVALNSPLYARKAAIRAIGRAGEEGFRPLLEKLKEDPIEIIRRLAISATSKLTAARSLPAPIPPTPELPSAPAPSARPKMVEPVLRRG